MAAVAISNAARWILVLSEVVYANWDQISRLFNRAEQNEQDLYGYVVKVVFEMRNGTAGVWDERGEFGIHWVNTTGGDLDVTWTNADFAAVEAGITAWWTNRVGSIPTTIRLVELRWYAFGPGIIGTKAEPNPVARVTPVAGTPAGTAAGSSMRQYAVSHTFKTPLRLHWGRIYAPFTSSQVDAAGRLTQALCQSHRDAMRTLLKSGEAQGVYPCIYDRARKSVLGITDVQVDDIPDVVRRRRPKHPSFRETVALA